MVAGCSDIVDFVGSQEASSGKMASEARKRFMDV
jgi:hypothetical protein